MTSIIRESLEQGYPVILTGHSRGGALAVFAFRSIMSGTHVNPSVSFSSVKKLQTRTQIKLVTFGAPQIGNKDFVDAFKSHRDQITQFSNVEDLVTKIPPYFYHVKEPANLSHSAQDRNKCSSKGGKFSAHEMCLYKQAVKRWPGY